MSLDSVQLIHFFTSAINQARQNPFSVFHYLKQRRFDEHNQFQHSILPNIKYKTEEGQDAVDEAINFLSMAQKKNKLIISQVLCEAAYQVGIEMAKQKFVDNPLFYASLIKKEIEKISSGNVGQINIIVEYGFRMDPQIIPSIIVDDGDNKRTRRYQLMNQNIKYLGIGVHEHSQFDYMVVILLTDRIDEGGCSCSIF